MQNNIIKNPAEFVDLVEQFSKMKLKRKAELLRVCEEVLISNKQKTFEELIFTAKYVCGLLRIVRNSPNDPDNINLDSLKADFSDNINKVLELLKEIISDAPESFKQYFAQNYFELSQQNFLNLTELLNDFEWTKMYLNDLKRKQQQ